MCSSDLVRGAPFQAQEVPPNGAPAFHFGGKVEFPPEVFQRVPIFRKHMGKLTTEGVGVGGTLDGQSAAAAYNDFAGQFILGSVLLDLGLRPEHVSGESVGELVAAVMAGMLSLQDALQLVTVQGSAKHKFERRVSFQRTDSDEGARGVCGNHLGNEDTGVGASEGLGVGSIKYKPSEFSANEKNEIGRAHV